MEIQCYVCIYPKGWILWEKGDWLDQFLSNLEVFQYLLVIFDTQILKEIINNMVSSINSHVYSDLRIEKAISKVA